MFTKLKIALALTAIMVLSSCESINDDYANCGVWLEFVFDHNMEYTDSFYPQVETVDVYIFDQSGKFVQTIHAATSDLDRNKRMFLGNMPFGEYKILAVGNLTEHFRFTDRNGVDFVPGTTTIEHAMSALKHNGMVSHEFSHFYFGQAVEVAYNADLSVYMIPLIRQTNNFNIVLQTVVKSPENSQGAIESVHTVEIVAPESGAYDWLNNPVAPNELIYHPYYLISRIYPFKDETLLETVAKINTMRLLENESNGYRIIIRDVKTGEELWSKDLVSLLADTKIGEGKRPDGTELPLSEYLDREGNWNIVIVYISGANIGNEDPVDPDPDPDPDPGPVTPNNAFTAIRININNWIVWQQGIELN
ncbi:MAG: FimB/Mfa2 family fimbrial subunit [Bacteroidales bacterium]|nr:FimB/Mfa2 family fimbrial subunit [Bacteroidales bacterium]